MEEAGHFNFLAKILTRIYKPIASWFMGHNQSVRRPHDAAFDHGSSLFQCLHIARGEFNNARARRELVDWCHIYIPKYLLLYKSNTGFYTFILDVSTICILEVNPLFCVLVQ